VRHFSNAATQGRGVFTAAGVRRGFAAAQGIAFGSFIYGVTFGLLALGVGRTALEALAMSMFIYSGSAQTVALGSLAAGAGVAATVVTVLLLNARYTLYSASLRPWLHGVGVARSYGTLFLLGDGSWLLSMQARERGEEDAGYLFGASIACFITWILGTLIGAGAGRSMPRPEVLGLDFLLVAFCAAMMMAMIRVRTRCLTAITVAAALVAALVADRFLGRGWPVIVAGLTGVVIAYALFRTPEEETA
jgi:4-azaleucine resistance transporter AzlC